jgi:hypothetical protein
MGMAIMVPRYDALMEEQMAAAPPPLRLIKPLLSKKMSIMRMMKTKDLEKAISSVAAGEIIIITHLRPANTNVTTHLAIALAWYVPTYNTSPRVVVHVAFWGLVEQDASSCVFSTRYYL